MTATEVVDRSQKIAGAGISESGTTNSTITNIDDSTKSAYHLKWIHWNSGKIPIVMQTINGPCPLIATMNVLLLREKVKLPDMLEQITADQLLTYLGECIMDSLPANIYNDDEALLNLEQHIHEAMEILPKLKTGLDVNIKFTGITDFEYTPECIIFDLLRIPLYHGWLSDPSITELQNVIGNQSYNQLVDYIITNKNSNKPEDSAKVLQAEEFLKQTASQLTHFGLGELKRLIKDNEIGILFRNNHFLTLFKREGEIYTLVTDHGYLIEDNVIWETLDNIEGAGRFFDSNFEVPEITNRQVSEFNSIDQRHQQLENDFLIALSLKDEEGLEQGGEGEVINQEPEDDFELAKRLQAEEDKLFIEMNRKNQVERWVEPNKQRLDNKSNGEEVKLNWSKYSQLKEQNKPSMKKSVSELGAETEQVDAKNSKSNQMIPEHQNETSTTSPSTSVSAQVSSSENSYFPSDSFQNVYRQVASSSSTQQPSSATTSTSNQRGPKSEKSQKETTCIVI